MNATDTPHLLPGDTFTLPADRARTLGASYGKNAGGVQGEAVVVESGCRGGVPEPRNPCDSATDMTDEPIMYHGWPVTHLVTVEFPNGRRGEFYSNGRPKRLPSWVERKYPYNTNMDGVKITISKLERSPDGQG